MYVRTLSLALYALATASTGLASSSYTIKETHTPPASWKRLGSALKSELIHLQLGLKQGTQGLVEKHLLEVSDPKHERYGQHLSAEEVHNLVRPSEETINQVHSWLTEHEVGEIAYSPAQDWVSITVPIEKAEELLQAEYSIFEHEHDGDWLSRTTEWSLPEHLHRHIDVVQPTTSFFRTHRNVRAGPVHGHAVSQEWWENEGKANEDAGSSIAQICNVTFTTPKCLRTLYGTKDYTPKVPGKNQIGVNNYLNETQKRSDISKFLKHFRPKIADAAQKFKLVNIAHANHDQGPYTKKQVAAEKNIEANLDAETIISISWPTPFTGFSTGGSPPFLPNKNNPPPDTNEPYLTWLNYALAQKTLPQVISSSYGDDEATVPLAYADKVCSMFAQLGARGISLLVSSGDAGVGGNGTCVNNGKRAFTPAFPTDCPWVTSVGATANFQPETAVSRFASGAGFSNYFGMPKYQQAVVEKYIQGLDGLHNGLYNKSGRAYPDVAAQGNHDAIVWDGQLITVGGTSASSPTFAAVISLVNDALIAKGKSPLGFLNPWIYGGAYSALTDVTEGTSYGCNSSGFPATKGWDAVTGFGTPNFSKLVDAAMSK